MEHCNAAVFALHKAADDLFTVEYGGQTTGSIELYSNSFHRQNQYLRLHLLRYEKAWAVPLFALLRHTVAKPLQVMLSSQDAEQAGFLLAGGFECKRKCYEMEVSGEAFFPGCQALMLNAANRGQAAYTICCRLLYEYYKGVHAAINPLTADYAAFCEKLPEAAFYSMTDQKIRHVAFVEENEIAYAASIDMEHFQPFAETVAAKLLATYETICFECDDCDTAAMTLKKLFRAEPEVSYDTYIRK